LISELAEIHSPKFFQFSIPVTNGQVEEASFKLASELPHAATVAVNDKLRQPIQAPQPDKHHMSKKAKVVTLVVLGCVIATAIAVPIAVACGTAGGGNNNQQRALQAFALQSLLTGR
jgi:hypothetical protein